MKCLYASCKVNKCMLMLVTAIVHEIVMHVDVSKLLPVHLLELMDGLARRN